MMKRFVHVLTQLAAISSNAELHVTTQSATRSFTVASHDAVIRVYRGAGNVIATHEQPGEFKEW